MGRFFTHHLTPNTELINVVGRKTLPTRFLYIIDIFDRHKKTAEAGL